MCPSAKIEGNVFRLRTRSVHFVGHLPTPKILVIQAKGKQDFTAAKKSVPGTLLREQKSNRKNLPLSQPFWLAGDCSPSRLSVYPTGIFGSRISCMTAQTMMRQLISVVKVSI
jgi:hypothetical protein